MNTSIIQLTAVTTTLQTSSAAPADLPITITQGADWSWKFEVKANPTGAMLPVDITGAALDMQVRAQAADYGAIELISASTAFGRIVITDSPNGKFTVTIPGSATVLPGLIPRDDQAVWEMTMTAAGGEITALAGGLVTFFRRVVVP